MPFYIDPCRRLLSLLPFFFVENLVYRTVHRSKKKEQSNVMKTATTSSKEIYRKSDREIPILYVSYSNKDNKHQSNLVQGEITVHPTSHLYSPGGSSNLLCAFDPQISRSP